MASGDVLLARSRKRAKERLPIPAMLLHRGDRASAFDVTPRSRSVVVDGGRSPCEVLIAVLGKGLVSRRLRKASPGTSQRPSPRPHLPTTAIASHLGESGSRQNRRLVCGGVGEQGHWRVHCFRVDPDHGHHDHVQPISPDHRVTAERHQRRSAVKPRHGPSLAPLDTAAGSGRTARGRGGYDLGEFFSPGDREPQL